MAIKSPRSKGAAGERELADLLMQWAIPAGKGIELKRNLEQVRSGGHDLMGLEAYGMAVEVKRVEELALNAWWDQAVRQADRANCEVPVLAWRQNRRPWRFRVRTWVWPAKVKLDVDMDSAAFRLFFLEMLRK